MKVMRTPSTHTLPTAIAFTVFTSIFFFSCSRHTGRFRLEGEFKNLNQGEFYLYTLEGGTKDTIAVNDGAFVYERPMKDTATYIMLFPNYSEMPIFARPDVNIVMTGDVTHLRETQVTGSAENEEMTAFRIKTNDMTPPEAKKEAERYIRQHTASPVSIYLLRRYFLQEAQPDYSLALELCDTIRRSQPQNLPLARLAILLEGLKSQSYKGQLPPFSAVSTKGDTISNKQLKGDANVLLTWATWSYESQNTLRQLKSLAKELRGSLRVLAICLDASPSEGQKFIERDSISWPVVCDGMIWQSPLLAQLGIGTLPSNIVTDKNGNIVGRNLDDNQLKEKLKSMLGNKQETKQ